MTADKPLGVVAAFVGPGELLRAASEVRARGYERVDAFSPVPVEGLREALGFRRTRLPWVVFGAGALGAAIGLWLQYYITAVNYPINVAGRPLASWPSFMIITFELCVLLAGLTAGIGMLVANRLPRPHHPLFDVREFAERANTDRYFLWVEAADPRFEAEEVRALFRELDAEGVYDVPA